MSGGAGTSTPSGSPPGPFSEGGALGVIAINVVPEPASLVLLGIGLLAPMGAWWLRLGRARAAG